MKSLSVKDLERAQASIDQAVELFRRIADAIELYSAGLDELKNMRMAVKQGIAPGDFHDFIEYVAETDRALADSLRGSEVRRFDMGRFWLVVPDNHARCLLDLSKGRIQGLLERRYGTGFKVRINAPKHAAPDF